MCMPIYHLVGGPGQEPKNGSGMLSWANGFQKGSIGANRMRWRCQLLRFEWNEFQHCVLTPHMS